MCSCISIVLICIFLMTSDVGKFNSLIYQSISSLVNCLFKYFVHILIWFYVFLLKFENLYIVNGSLLLGICYTNIFSQSVACLSIFLAVSHGHMKNRFFFLEPQMWHMEIPRLGVKSELQLLANSRSELRLQTTPQLMAMLDP